MLGMYEKIIISYRGPNVRYMGEVLTGHEESNVRH